MLQREVKHFATSWLQGNTVTSKLVLVVLFPHGAGDPKKLEEFQSSYRKACQLTMDESLKTENYFLPPNGIECLHQSSILGKKFIKKLHELVITYYREKKDNIKRQ